MNFRRLKMFLKFHWIKLLITLLIVAVILSLVIFIKLGLDAWKSLEAFYKQTQMAALPLQLYLYIVGGMIMACIYVFLWYWMMFRGGGFQQATQIKKKAIAGEEVGVKWDDIIGMEEAKQEALEVVKLITDRVQLQRMGGKILRGILMLGPPGCGKTYLAKGIATESKLPFISISGSEFVEMFVGVGASRIRKLFKQAHQLAYTEGGCIIFIDEIDAVGAQRAIDRGFGGQTEFNTTLNQLLVEMDGLKEKEYNVVIIGATNVPETFLDPALLRPGRFDRKIYVTFPDLEAREKLFQYYLSKTRHDEDIDIGRLARKAVYKTPADVANIVRESTLIAIRNRKEKIGMKELADAMERIEMGIKHRVKMTPQEKERVAFHEAGHAIVMYVLHPTDDVFKASIISRGAVLGQVVQHPREELYLSSRDRILANIKASLGGYVAEKLRFSVSSDGVSQDFRRAIHEAHNMVWRFGMGENGLIGDYTTIPQEQISESLKESLNQETQKIMKICLKEVEDLLAKERPLLDRFAKELIQKEELEYDEIQAIFKEYGFEKNIPSQPS
ncbi:MAG: AAA family ATPase [Candidatus Omnitrophota bacterium]|nr:AAA family ATPase [Candidatus Omnitrophota bacterium]